MKIKTLIPSLILIFSSCTILDVEHYSIDPRLKVFVDDFYSDAWRFKVNLQKERLYVIVEDYGNLDRAGLSFGGDDIRSISISKKLIDNYELKKDSLSFYKIKYTVYHELGHALLYREHENENTKSIMTANSEWESVFSCECAYKNGEREFLIRELFKR